MRKMVNKGISIILAMLMVVGGMSELIVPMGGKAYASGVDFAGGTGTSDDPYRIATADQLNEVRNHLTASFTLTADIDLSSYANWVPIGNDFHGNMDGNGYKIKHLTINKPADGNLGLFQIISGEVTNMVLEDVNVTGLSNVGSLTGTNNGTICNSAMISGSMNGVMEVGGLVGHNGNTISNSYAAGSVSGRFYVEGGFGSHYVGGLVGANDFESIISNSYATGIVSGDSNSMYVGGLVGQSYGQINNSYATGEVTGATNVGGLVGDNNSSISDSYATGSVNGSSDIGGLVGNNNSVISYSYATGSVSGENNNIGGLAGSSHYQQINDSYATGRVNGTTNVGGLVGDWDSGMVLNSFAIGPVIGTTSVGGLIGKTAPNGYLFGGFYDNETTGQSDTGKGTGLSTEQMQTQNTYWGWNFFSEWYIMEGQYPQLWAFTALTQGTVAGTTGLNHVAIGMGYTINNGSYIAITDTSVDNIRVNAQDTIVVWANIDSYSAKMLTVDLNDIKPAEAPTSAALAVGTNPGTTKLTGLANTMEYKVNSSSYKAAAGSSEDNIYANIGDLISVRIAATDQQPASAAQVLTVVEADRTPPLPIATAAIDGVTAPVTGATPVSILEATSEYTATIAWSKADAVFAGAAVYTAMITITPKAGYTLEDVGENFFTVAGATTTTNAAGSGVVTAVFPATAPEVIATAAIAGVTPPVKGETPVSTIADTSEYTATIAWSPTATKFAANTVYTTTITITPKAGYTLTGVGEDFFTVAGATTATNAAGSGVVTAVFPATAPEVIATAAIAGVTPPAKGATPVSTIADTSEYTATIAWSPTATKFAANTVYTATITITPKAGYTLTGVGEDFFTVAGATTTNAAGSGVVTAVFPATAPEVIATAAIAGVTPPVKGATPVSTIADTSEYTATIAWSPTTTKFAANTVYTATITITPKAGYTLTGVGEDFFTVAGATTTTNAAGSGVVTAVFPATARETSSSGGGSGGGSTTPSDSIVTPTDGNSTVSAGRAGEVSLNNEVTVSIPAGATDKELKLTIEKLAGTPNLLTDKDVLASPIFEIMKNFSENFSKPVTLTFVFDPTKLSGKQRAAVFYYDEAKKVWVEVPDSKVTGNLISVVVNHFTKYAVFVVDQEAAVSTPDPNPTINLSDIAGHWAEANIKHAVSGGIVAGYPDGTFKPGKSVTRSEFAVMLMNALKPQEEGTELTFTDAAKIPAWAQKAVAQAVQVGIIKGYKDGTFHPDAEITRAEMASMLANALQLTIEENAATSFADDKNIPTWARGAVAAMKELGVMEGSESNQFNADAHATRAEAVTVLLRLLEQKSK